MSTRDYSSIVGKKFGRFIVLDASEMRRVKKGTMRYARCRCDCGKEATVCVCSLKSGASRSCGCLKAENKKHGLHATPEYNAWANMKNRCTNPNWPRFKDYGGRGIKVCDRWQNSFKNFISDMGSRPSDKHTIERMDNSNGYLPENCCWAIRKQQMRNTRANRMLTINGETRCIAEWMEISGIKPRTFRWRLDHGWSMDRIMSPVHSGV